VGTYNVAAMSQPENASQQPTKDPRKSWQSRIAEATDALAQSFVESISYDRRLYKDDIAGSIAHAAMLAKVGLITEDERGKIEEGLRSIERDIESGSFQFDESLEDIHMAVEDALIKRVGEPGRKLHTGRSRNDQVALDFVLWINEARRKLVDDTLDALVKSFVGKAEVSGDIVIPTFTHLQRAQPISAGAELLAWATAFDRCAARFIDDIWLLADSNPLGSGAIAGTSLPIDREATSKILHSEDRLPTGFRDSSYSSIFCTMSRDVACDFVFSLAMTAQWLSRWDYQCIIYMSTEFGFI
jgi:argininosuccinate lyase